MQDRATQVSTVLHRVLFLNLVGIIGVRIAGTPPDDDHPYGHRKFETMASIGILIFLIIVLREVL